MKKLAVTQRFGVSSALHLACAALLAGTVACSTGSNPPLPQADGGSVARADGGAPAADGGAVLPTDGGGTTVAYADCAAPADGGAPKSNLIVMNPQDGVISKRIDLSCFAENAGLP